MIKSIFVKIATNPSYIVVIKLIVKKKFRSFKSKYLISHTLVQFEINMTGQCRCITKIQAYIGHSEYIYLYPEKNEFLIKLLLIF